MIKNSYSEEFKIFSKKVNEKFNSMQNQKLLEVSLDNISEIYLASFPEGTDVQFRKRTFHDCSCCKHFLKNIGNVVSIDENGMIDTVWNIPELPYPYNIVAEKLHEIVSTSQLNTLFKTAQNSFGKETTQELSGDTVINWNHFHGEVNSSHICNKNDIGEIIGNFNTTRSVYLRSLKEITLNSIETVSDLINENLIYRGSEHKTSVDSFLELKRKYDSLPESEKEKFTFIGRVHPIKNTVIGSLLEDLSKGIPVEDTVRMFESKVAPQNYKRPTAIVTEKMLEEALITLRKNNLENSIHRRQANITDISINNVLFADRSVTTKMKDSLKSLLLDSVVSDIKINENEFSNISYRDFIQNVLPSVSSIELFLENSHLSNFMTLTTALDETSENIFKWDNKFAWSYDGDFADTIREKVKNAGGNIEAKMRVSLHWFNRDDLDIHCIPPCGERIYFGNRQGILDVDMNNTSKPICGAVENLSFQECNLRRDGVYKFYVNNWSKRDTVDVGFEIEFEFNKKITNYLYKKPLENGESVNCIYVAIKGGELESVKTFIEESNRAIQKWGLSTNKYIPVETILLSPNHWDGQKIGNEHLFFILKDCKNPDPVRGIYNEFLKEDLMKHKKFFELLASKSKAEFTENQLSGVGFSSTKEGSVKVLVKGNLNKKLKINF